MDDSVLPSKLLNHLYKAADIVRSHDCIQIFSHFDADGISASAIVAKALLREGKEFRITHFTTLNDSNMEIIRNTPAECMVITDLGASYIKDLDAMTCDIVVLDHHTIVDTAERICYANPHLYGIDGMTSGCGATMAFLFAITLNEKNWDLVSVAMGGIAGDRQHINGILGLNAYLLDEGIKKGYIKVIDGSLIPLGNLSCSLFNSTDPYISGVSGNEEGVIKILNDAGIPSNKNYMDLTDEEKRKLTSLIAVKLIRQGVCRQTLNEVSRKRYYLPNWGIDAEKMSSLLNGCGRLGLVGIGAGFGMGDKDCRIEAEKLETEAQKHLMDGVIMTEQRGLNQRRYFQWFDSSTSGFTGMVCGVLMQFIGDPDKPTIGINASEETAKVSSRGMWVQLDRGIDLSVAMKNACEAVGGNGGGHKIASGGSFESTRTEEFMDALDKILESQINASRHRPRQS